MFISVTYPIADFRALHRERAGMLVRPSWGSSDPQAAFARGFGSIHTRTRSGNGFIGENYYADCGNIIKYPSQIFVKPVKGMQRRILSYPIYRRFYFDGLMAGRFELGFRLNEPSIEELLLLNPDAEFRATDVARQIFDSIIRVELLDNRNVESKIHESMDLLRDGWLLSSTSNKLMNTYNIRSVGSLYVGVGSPFIFIRGGSEINLSSERQSRSIIKSDDVDVFASRSGIHRQMFDTIISASPKPLDQETAKERIVRLFYTQIRTLAFAHSFYIKQTTLGLIEGPKSIDGSLKAFIERIKNLTPIDENHYDEITCNEMKKILNNLDIDIGKLESELEERIRPSWLGQKLSMFFKYIDKKADKAIEAAASAATKQTLGGF